MTEYADHVRALLSELDIHEVRVENYMQAEAKTNWRTVRIPEIVDDLTYMVALHEIGHIMTHTMKNSKLVREAKAWEWALDHLVHPISGLAWNEGFKSLNNYLNQHQHAKEMGWPEAYVPPKKSMFWRVHTILSNLAMGS